MKALLVAAVAASLVPSPALAWGKTGHRVVAAIADTQLSGLARAHVKEILGGAESLDEAANWPDEMRSEPVAVLAEDRDALALCDPQRDHLRPRTARGRRAPGALAFPLRSAGPEGEPRRQAACAALRRSPGRRPSPAPACRQMLRQGRQRREGDLVRQADRTCTPSGIPRSSTRSSSRSPNLPRNWSGTRASGCHRLVGRQPAPLDQRKRADPRTQSIPPPPTCRRSREGAARRPFRNCPTLTSTSSRRSPIDGCSRRACGWRPI